MAFDSKKFCLHKAIYTGGERFAVSDEGVWSYKFT